MLALLLSALSLVVSVGLALRMRDLAGRLAASEGNALPCRPKPSLESSPLAGLRVALDLDQDHPNAPFAALLRERLLREDVILDENADLAVSGTLVCNGYADVYYRAEIAVRAGGETLFLLAEKPPHGDRPENLALELVDRLKTEWAKRERQGAIRELHDA